MRKFFIILLFLFLCPHAMADGMFGVYDHDTWSLQPENQQLAAIHYSGGKENLLLSITTDKDLKGDKAVWIFPIPSGPEDVTIDVVDEFPSFYGSDLDQHYKNTIMSVSGWMVGYATTPVGLMYGYPLYQVLMLRSGPPTMGIGHGISDQDTVTIYNHIERYGVTTELVTAKDSGSLSRYLNTKGMVLPDSSQTVFSDYIGKDYSFVVTYISDLSEFQTHSGKYSFNVVSTFVSFPTDRIYFPLKPTSVYGGRQVPVSLYVTGIVTPNLYDGIRPGTETTYYNGNVFFFNKSAQSLFFNGINGDFPERTSMKYTRIRINSPSSAFTDDLWIDEKSPLPDPVKDFILAHAVILGIGAYIIFSMIASLVAGMIWFRKNPVPKKKLLLHGLWNCLTLVGFVAATRKFFRKENDESRSPFVLIFYLIFAGLITTTVLVLVPTLGKFVAYAWGLAILGPLISAIYPSFLTISPHFFFLNILRVILGCIHIIFLCLILWSLYNWLDGEKNNLLPSNHGMGLERNVYLVLKYTGISIIVYLFLVFLTFSYEGRPLDSIWPILELILICLGFLLINAVLIYALRGTSYIVNRIITKS